MPYGDRTGPLGAGPMTGRGMGFCAGFNRPGYMNPGGGIGFRMGFGGGFGGRGRGWRNMYYGAGNPGWARGGRFFYPEYDPLPFEADYSEEDELKILKNQYKALEKNLSEMKKRIAELEGSKGE